MRTLKLNSKTPLDFSSFKNVEKLISLAPDSTLANNCKFLFNFSMIKNMINCYF